MGLDSSRGGGNDASCLVVLDATVVPITEVACLRSTRLNAFDLAEVAYKLHEHGYAVTKGNRYVPRSGGLVPEINEEALPDALKALFPYDYWYVETKDATPSRLEERAVRFGFYTTERAKTRVISGLSRAIKTMSVRVNNPWLRDEARYWTRIEGEWKYTLESGSRMGHGDVSIAYALALAGVDATREWQEQRRAIKTLPVAPPRVFADWSKETSDAVHAR